MAEGYKEGYDKGFSDGKNDKPKKVIATLKELFIMAFHSKTYTDEFFSGYNKGYEEGILQKNLGK